MNETMDRLVTVTGLNEVPVNFLAGMMPARRPSAQATSNLADVLLEQLEYLIEFSDLEPQRFAAVKSILLERFN
jgi:hypothetical protein